MRAVEYERFGVIQGLVKSVDAKGAVAVPVARKLGPYQRTAARTPVPRSLKVTLASIVSRGRPPPSPIALPARRSTEPSAVRIVEVLLNRWVWAKFACSWGRLRLTLAPGTRRIG